MSHATRVSPGRSLAVLALDALRDRLRLQPGCPDGLPTQATPAVIPARRPYLLVWAWHGENPEVSAAHLDLTPAEAADLRERFLHLSRNDELWAFRLAEETGTALTYAEFLDETPALWGALPQNGDEPITPDQFPAA